MVATQVSSWSSLPLHFSESETWDMTFSIVKPITFFSGSVTESLNQLPGLGRNLDKQVWMGRFSTCCLYRRLDSPCCLPLKACHLHESHSMNALGILALEIMLGQGTGTWPTSGANGFALWITEIQDTGVEHSSGAWHLGADRRCRLQVFWW